MRAQDRACLRPQDRLVVGDARALVVPTSTMRAPAWATTSGIDRPGTRDRRRPGRARSWSTLRRARRRPSSSPQPGARGRVRVHDHARRVDHATQRRPQPVARTRDKIDLILAPASSSARRSASSARATAVASRSTDGSARRRSATTRSLPPPEARHDSGARDHRWFPVRAGVVAGRRMIHGPPVIVDSMHVARILPFAG